MKVTTLLKGIVSLVSALFLILQLVLIGSAAFIRPAYEENWTLIGGPPPGFSTQFNITNQGIIPVQNLVIYARVYNSSGDYLEGYSLPATIQAFTTKVITINMYEILPGGTITDGNYTLIARVTGAFLGALISFTIVINYTSTFNFPP
ncbi:MAG: hypothetical protein ACTSQO_13450 [Candidatus Helarchaeota archaeon]